MATHNERCKALAIAIAADVPALIWGLPGEGKTAVIEQIARHNNMHLETIIASIHAPEDFKGMPMVDPSGKMVYSAPDWAQNLVEQGGGIGFFDEISTAAPSTQAALLRPILSKVAGNVTLPAATRFVAAANPPEIAADGWDLSAPLANRFVHFDWEVDAATIANGFSFGFEDVDLPTINTEKVDGEFVNAKAAIGAFLMSRPDMKSKMPTSSTESGRAWPSPRSWEMGAKVLGYARAANAGQSVENILLAGAVGPAAAREFLTWESALDLPDVEKAIKEGKIALPDRADKIYMTAAAITRALLDNPTKARMDAGVNKLFVAIADAGHRDIAVVGLRQVGKKFNESKAILTPEAIEHFGAILQAMGKI